MTENAYLLLDVGGTFIKVGAGTPDGKLLPDFAFSIPIDSNADQHAVTTSLQEAVHRGITALRAQRCSTKGIALDMPGPFDYKNGISHMQHKFASIYGLPLGELIAEIPEVGHTIPVCFSNDVVSALMGELNYGYGMEYDNTAIVTLGTGLGFGFSHNHEPQLAPTGSPSVIIYNYPCKGQILEDFVSKRGFLSIYSSLRGCPNDASLTVADLGRMATEGDEVALHTFDTAGHILGHALRPILERYDIECLLFAGQISKSFAHFQPAITQEVGDLPKLYRVAPAKHIGEAAFYGLCSILNRELASK